MKLKNVATLNTTSLLRFSFNKFNWLHPYLTGEGDFIQNFLESVLAMLSLHVALQMRFPLEHLLAVRADELFRLSAVLRLVGA